MWLWNNAGGQNVFYTSILPPFLSIGGWRGPLDSGHVDTDGDNVKTHIFETASESLPLLQQGIQQF